MKEITILNKAKYIEEIFKQNVEGSEKNILIKSFFMQLPKLFLEKKFGNLKVDPVKYRE